MPYIGQIALGALLSFKAFGSDCSTQDDTCLRGYIHIDKLARGHVLAVDYLKRNPGMITVNLRAGKSFSTIEMIAAFEKVKGKKILYDLRDRKSDILQNTMQIQT